MAEVDAFEFVDKVSVQLSSTVFSDAVVITGTGLPKAISIDFGEYSINGGAYTSAAGVVNDGDSVIVRHTSSSSYNTPASSTLTVGSVSDRFTSYTVGTPAFIPSRAPRSRSINARTLTIVLDGPEKPYDHYRFSGGKKFFQKPNHNPFEDL